MTDIISLGKEIEEYHKKIAENLDKIKELKSKSKYTEEQMEVATMLHEMLCNMDHTEVCDWYYDQGYWSTYSRQEYIKKAINLLRHFSKEQIVLFINLI